MTLSTATKLDPQNLDIKNSLGLILSQLVQPETNNDDTLATLTRAADLAPQNAQIQNSLGLVLLQKGRPDQAVRAFQKAIRIDPSYGAALTNLEKALSTNSASLQ